MEKIIKINTCTKCPHCQTDRDYTEDSFEFCMKWHCKLSNKNIRRYVDWYDNKPFIPDWCELEN